MREKRKAVFSKAGCGQKQMFVGKYAEDGKLELHASEVIDTYAQTQADKLSCDINYILARYASGDTTALAKAQGVFADVSEMPTNYAEVLNIVRFAENRFDALPVEVKAAFGNDVNQFIATMGTESWNKNLGIMIKPAIKPDVVVKTEEVKAVE